MTETRWTIRVIWGTILWVVAVFIAYRYPDLSWWQMGGVFYMLDNNLFTKTPEHGKG